MKLLLIILSLWLLSGCTGSEDPTDYRARIYVRNNGADIPAHIYGNVASKKLLVYLHGGPGGSGSEYRDRSTIALEEHFGVVYTDQRGQGAAHGQFDSTDVSIEQLAEDVYVLIRSLKSHFSDDYQVVLIGHSWGGLLGTAFLLNDRYQTEVDGWIEVGGAHDLPMLNKAAIQMFTKYANENIQADNDADGKWQEILDFCAGVDTNNITYDQTFPINQYAFEAEVLLGLPNNASLIESGAFYNDHPLTKFLAGNHTNNLLDPSISRRSLTDSLHLITLPVMFIWGEHDFVVPPRLGKTGFQAIGSADKAIHIVPNAGHSPMVNDPEGFTELVKNFVERL